MLAPSDEKQLADIVAEAAAEKRSLEIVAGGSKRAFGRPVKADALLDLSQLSGIVGYEPAELILTARPATPLAAIRDALREKGQMLAFEPPLWRGLFQTDAEPTLGGALACNLSGPRRARAGAARDFILGFSAVNGRGELFKAGGKVVKNVTGFDLSKLMVGAFGTLSVFTEVTLKVMPAPENQCTILLPALADERAVKIMAQALNTPFEVSGVAHLPEAVARRGAVVSEAGAVTAIRTRRPRALGRFSRRTDRKAVWRRRAAGGRDISPILGGNRRGPAAAGAGRDAGLAALPDAQPRRRPDRDDQGATTLGGSLL